MDIQYPKCECHDCTQARANERNPFHVYPLPNLPNYEENKMLVSDYTKLKARAERYEKALKHILNPVENDERTWDNYRMFAEGIAKAALALEETK